MLGPHMYAGCPVRRLHMAMRVLQSANCSGLALDARYALTLSPVGLVLLSAIGLSLHECVDEMGAPTWAQPRSDPGGSPDRPAGLTVPSRTACKSTIAKLKNGQEKQAGREDGKQGQERQMASPVAIIPHPPEAAAGEEAD